MMSLRSLDTTLSTAKTLRNRPKTLVLMGLTLVLSYLLTTVASASVRNVIDNVDVVGDDQDRIIRIHTGTRPTFTVFKLTNPMRVVIDVSGGDVSAVDGPLDIDDGIVEQIATRQFSSNGFYVGRVIIGFQTDVTYNVKAEDDALVIRASTASMDVQQALPAPERPVDPKELERITAAKKLAQAAQVKATQNQRQAEELKAQAEKTRVAASQAQENAKAERAKASAAIAQANQKLEAASVKESKIAAESQNLDRQRKQIEKRNQALEEKQSQGQERLAKQENELKNRQAKAEKAAKRNQAEAQELAKREKEIMRREAQAKAAAKAQARHQTEVKQATLTGVKKNGKGLNTAVLLTVKGNPSLQVERIENPPRLVIDMMETTRDSARSVYGVKSPYVRRVRLGEHDKNLRAVLDLRDGNSTHHVKKVPEGILISMSRVEPEAEIATGGPEQEKALELSDVQFNRQGKIARIELGIAPEEMPRVDTRSKKAWILNIKGATISKALEKSLDTTAYDTVVRLVSTYQASENPPVVKVVANITGPAKHRLKKENGKLIWEITGDGNEPARVASSSAPQTAGFVSQAASTSKAVQATTRSKRKKKKPITLDLQDADMINVLRLLSEISGENIIASDEVKGNITLRLRNVPWDQALDTILRTKGYSRVRQNNIIRIAPASVIQEERKAELERRELKAKAEPTAIKLVTVNYAIAADIKLQLEPLMTERGSVQTDERTNTLIVEDVLSNIDRLVLLTRKLDKQTPQVLIEARIVEANSNELQELGIQWGGVGQMTANEGNPTGLQFPGDVTVSGAASDQGTLTQGTYSPAQYAVNLPAAIGSGSGGGLGFIFGSAGGSQLLALRLTAMEERGTGRIISSPRITTLDNKTAKIAQGLDIPISVVSASGTNTKFVPANLELEVTPHVTNDGSILMQVKTEKNEADFSRTGAQGDPTILKKFAETEVLVADGDTTVIGGIYTRTTSETYAGVPFFSDIPVIGWLFKKRQKTDKRAELLIFITPRIVNRRESRIQASSLSTEPEKM
jgi:type IV pilus assembly protein PilQ